MRPRPAPDVTFYDDIIEHLNLPLTGWGYSHKIASDVKLVIRIEANSVNLRQSTRNIVKLVEEQTGFPVQVLEDSKLPTMATVRIARGNLPAHIITIKPVPGEQPDYLIAFQCGCRLFARAGN